MIYQILFKINALWSHMSSLFMASLALLCFMNTDVCTFNLTHPFHNWKTENEGT